MDSHSLCFCKLLFVKSLLYIMIYLDQSDSGSVCFLKAGPLSLFEFVLIAFALYITACLFKSIKTQKKKTQKTNKNRGIDIIMVVVTYLA